MPVVDSNILPNWLALLYKNLKNKSQISAEGDFKTASDLIEALAEHLCIVGLSIYFSLPESEKTPEVQRAMERRLRSKSSFGTWVALLQTLCKTEVAVRLKALPIDLESKVQDPEDPLFQARRELGKKPDGTPEWSKSSTSPLDFIQAVAPLRNRYSHSTLPSGWSRQISRAVLQGFERIIELCPGIISLSLIHVSTSERIRGRDGTTKTRAVFDVLQGDSQEFNKGSFETSDDPKHWVGGSLLAATLGDYDNAIPVPSWLAHFPSDDKRLRYFNGLEVDASGTSLWMHSRSGLLMPTKIHDLLGSIEQDAPFLLSNLTQTPNVFARALEIIGERAESRTVTQEFLEGVSAAVGVPADELRARVEQESGFQFENSALEVERTLRAAVEAAVEADCGPSAIPMLTRFARALDEAADDDKCLRLILEIASGRLDRPEAVTEAPETVVVTAEPTVEDYLEQDSFEDEAEMAAVTLVDDPELLMMTVATARALDLRDRIVAATGLSTRKVSRNLNAARGQTLLKNLFNFGRPAASATNPAMANEVDARRLSSNVQYPFHELFRLTVAQAGADDVRVQLVRVLDLGPQLVTRRLSESHGRTLLANIFVEQQTKEWIRKKTVRWAIDVQAEQHVHQLTQVSLKEVRARFARGAPQRTLERVFPEARWDG